MDLLTQMETFKRVVESGSLTRAARDLGLSVGSVSRQLEALEKDLGATLILRTTRRHHVTEAGHRWYQHSVRLLESLAEAKRSVRPEKGQGRLTVSVPLTIGMQWVLPAIARLRETHPHLTIEVRMEDQLIDLVAEGVDVVLRAGAPPPESSTLVARPLATFTRIAVASPAYLRRAGTPRSPSALGDHACLVQLTPGGAVRRWVFTRERNEEAVEVTGELAVSAPLALRELAMAGQGIAFVPEWLVAEALRSGALKRVLEGWQSKPVSMFAVFRVELRGAERVRALVAALQESLTSANASTPRR